MGAVARIDPGKIAEPIKTLLFISKQSRSILEITERSNGEMCFAGHSKLLRAFAHEILSEPMKDETEKKEHPGVFGAVPLEYWETADARQCGLIGSISGKRICIKSHVNMSLGAELSIRVFYPMGSSFEAFQVLTKIIGKNLCYAGWEVYEYELEFTAMSDGDRLKLWNALTIHEESIKIRTLDRSVMKDEKDMGNSI